MKKVEEIGGGLLELALDFGEKKNDEKFRPRIIFQSFSKQHFFKKVMNVRILKYRLKKKSLHIAIYVL